MKKLHQMMLCKPYLLTMLIQNLKRRVNSRQHVATSWDVLQHLGMWVECAIDEPESGESDIMVALMKDVLLMF